MRGAHVQYLPQGELVVPATHPSVGYVALVLRALKYWHIFCWAMPKVYIFIGWGMKKQLSKHDAEKEGGALSTFGMLDAIPAEIVGDFLLLCSHICRTPISFITMADVRRRWQWGKSKFSHATPEAQRDASFCDYSGLHSDIFVIPDTLFDERYVTLHSIGSAPNIRFYAGVPWATLKGVALGVLCVVNHVRGGLNMEQREALHALGRLIVSQHELRRNTAEVVRAAGEGDPLAMGPPGTVIDPEQRGFGQRAEKLRGEQPPGEPAHIIPQIVWTTLPDGTLDYYNHYWYNHPTLTHEQSRGKSWQAVLHPDDVRTCLQRWAKAVRTGDPYEAEYRFKRPSDDSYRWHRVCAAPFLDQDGSVIKWLGISTDIENQKRAVESQRALSEELARRVSERTAELISSNDRLSELAHVAAHDLQEPLRMVASYAQLLARRYQGRLDPDADEFIKYVMDGTVRMQQMIDGLLAYSLAGSAQGNLEQVDCNKLFNEVVGNLQVAIQESSATVTCDPLPTVYTNQTQLAQLFQNLISNAIKYRADRPPQIHVRAEHKDGAWQFSVRDNGIGIDPQYSSQIFMLFHRLPGQTRHTGTGIGLAICKKIVESLGGRIWVESEPGTGSTFYFTLPDKEDIRRNA